MGHLHTVIGLQFGNLQMVADHLTLEEIIMDTTLSLKAQHILFVSTVQRYLFLIY